jgi:hypothetical protein
MRVGDLVRFKTNDNEDEWKIGLLVRYDKVLKVAEIIMEDTLFYAPGRLVETHQRGRKR